MNLKHLQLNTSILKNPEKVANFIQDNNVDIACLQEVCYSIGGENPLIPLILKNHFFYANGVHFYYHPNNQTLSVGIVSRWPIIDYVCWYYNTPNYLSKNIQSSDQLFSDLINNNYPEFTSSRGLINSIKSRCILSALIQTPGGLVRAITTHFTVSDLCTETPQMYDMSQMVYSIIKNSSPLPTIFSADLNIRAQSYSVSKISEALTCHSADLVDTLSPSHKSKIKDFPQGLAVDHVFSSQLKHLDTTTIDVDFSEHKALISNFKI